MVLSATCKLLMIFYIGHVTLGQLLGQSAFLSTSANDMQEVSKQRCIFQW